MPGKYIIIGATGAIGSELAHNLSQQGFPLHLIARNEEAVKPLASSLNATYNLADVMQATMLQQAIAQGIEDDSCLGLAYCIGSIVIKPISSITEQDLLDCYRLNTVGAIVAIQAAKSALKKGQGSVVLFSTVAAHHGFPNHIVIANAKAAIEGLVYSAAAEFAPDVRVNAIAPSLTRSKMSSKFFAQQKIVDNLSNAHPMQRLGEPNDIAELAAFLLSPKSSWITGQIITIDGGRSTLTAL